MFLMRRWYMMYYCLYLVDICSWLRWWLLDVSSLSRMLAWPQQAGRGWLERWFTEVCCIGRVPHWKPMDGINFLFASSISRIWPTLLFPFVFWISKGTWTKNLSLTLYHMSPSLEGWVWANVPDSRKRSFFFLLFFPSILKQQYLFKSLKNFLSIQL